MKRWVLRYSVEAIMNEHTTQKEAQEALRHLSGFISSGEIVAPAEADVHVTDVTLNRESIEEDYR